MQKFDRYLLSQLMTLFGFFSLVLVLVYWINRAVVLFDQLIADGQSAWVFLEFTALSLPGVIRIVLPLAAFVAALYVTNRLSSDSELVVVQATGYSPWRLARPVMYFGLIVALMTMVLTHILVPASTRIYNVRRAEVSANVTSRLLIEGRFLSPIDNVTLYIRDVTREGELQDIFLSDTRDATEHVTYTAAKAYLVRTEAGPQLVMRDGMAQTLDTASNRLLVTTFSDFAYDVSGFVGASTRTGRNYREIGTIELLGASQALQDETGRSAADLLYEAHNRTAQALLAVVGALLGFSTLLTGGFSRFGVWRQVLIAIALVIVVKIVEAAAANAVRAAPEAWPLTYLPIIVGLIICWFLLTIAARPNLLRRRRKVVAA